MRALSFNGVPVRLAADRFVVSEAVLGVYVPLGSLPFPILPYVFLGGSQLDLSLFSLLFPR